MQKATAAAEAPTAEATKSTRLRSPSYPGIDLETAIKRANEFHDHERRNPANIEIAVKHWGFKPTSGGGYIVVAALKAFGLISDSGSGKARKIQLTELALRILLDKRPESAERNAAIKQAALNPRMHASLWQKYRSSLPSDDSLRHELIFDRKFNENSVDDFIREYRATIKFAKLTDDDSISSPVGDTGEGESMESVEQQGDSGRKTTFTPQPKQQVGPKEISLPVGLSEDGQPIFAHVRFDAPLKREMLASLRTLLDAVEKTLN